LNAYQLVGVPPREGVLLGFGVPQLDVERLTVDVGTMDDEVTLVETCAGGTLVRCCPTSPTITLFLSIIPPMAAAITVAMARTMKMMQIFER